MAETLHCDRCGGDNPVEARFCIDCGAAMGAAAVGPTTRLAGIACPSCNTKNPENARFCVVCGRGLVAATQPRPAPAQPPSPPRPAPAPRYNYPRVATPPTLMPSRPTPPTRRHTSRQHNHWVPIFLFGLVILAASRTLWPGLLILIGFSSLIHHSAQGHAERGMRVLLWMVGLTLLFATGTFWPGILLLWFIMAAADRSGGSHWRCW